MSLEALDLAIDLLETVINPTLFDWTFRDADGEGLTMIVRRNPGDVVSTILECPPVVEFTDLQTLRNLAAALNAAADAMECVYTDEGG